MALRGEAELIFGKNAMIRRCIRNMCEADEKPEWMAIVDVMRGNLRFVFERLARRPRGGDQRVRQAGAGEGGRHRPPHRDDPEGPCGLDAQTSFFQALNIATKINGVIEMLNDTIVIREGEGQHPGRRSS